MDAIVLITFTVALLVLIFIFIWFMLSFIFPMIFKGKYKCDVCQNKYSKINTKLCEDKKISVCDSCDLIAEIIALNYFELIDYYKLQVDLKKKEKQKEIEQKQRLKLKLQEKQKKLKRLEDG